VQMVQRFAKFLLCGMWKELTIICDVLFLSKGFFSDMGSQPERFPPIS